MSEKTVSKKKRPPPNPLPCGCVVMGYPELEAYGSDYELRMKYKDQHVKHCPLHAAAPDLLAACELLDLIARNGIGALIDIMPAVEAARAALAKAEGTAK